MLQKAESLILIVEDEPLVRQVTQLMLESVGFTVVAAGNAEEALQCLKEQPTVCVIVSDVQMPGALDGLTLIRKLRDDGLQIPAVLTSGRLHPSTLPPSTSFLPKPYTLPKLIAAVEEFLPMRTVPFTRASEIP